MWSEKEGGCWIKEEDFRRGWGRGEKRIVTRCDGIL